MTALSEFQQQAATVALKEMFEGNHFSICDLDKLIKLLGCVPNSKDYEALSCLHCVSWRDMPPELRNNVMEKVVEIVQTRGFDTEILQGKILHAQKQIHH